MLQNWPFFLLPAATSLFATTLSFAIGIALGIPLGLVRAFGPNMIGRRTKASLLLAAPYSFTTAYVEAIRGTPAFVQIIIVSSFVNRAFPGPDVVLWGGILALTINTVGYQAEVFRAGFQSIGQGQIDAAKSIGMGPLQTFANITLPQSLRLILLPLVNEWISLFKASAILWYISVQELMWAAKYLGYDQVRPIEAFLMVSFVYLVIIIPLSRAMNYIERLKRIPGLGVPEPTGGPRSRRTVATGHPSKVARAATALPSWSGTGSSID
jgi:polar amino acid transport system permease protein